MVRFETSLGNFTIEFFEKEAPISVKNFLRYVDDKHFDGTIFHRVIPGFVIQGGGMEPGLNQKDTHEPIKNEATNGIKNSRGTLSMARTNDINSATSQFFVNLKDNDFLDHKPGSNAAASPSGIGNTVRWPCSTSKPKIRGTPSRVSSTAVRCALRTRSRLRRLSIAPTRPARMAVM